MDTNYKNKIEEIETEIEKSKIELARLMILYDYFTSDEKYILESDEFGNYIIYQRRNEYSKKKEIAKYTKDEVVYVYEGIEKGQGIPLVTLYYTDGKYHLELGI